MKCLNCGEEIPKGMTSCKYCGHVVSLNSAKSAEEREIIESIILSGDIKDGQLTITALKDVARNTSNPDVQSLLLKHPSADVRAALARNKKISARLLRVLAQDANGYVKMAAESHKRHHEIANYELLDSVSKGLRIINWATDLELIEDMYKANYNGRKDKYEFVGWPEGWLETLARFTTDSTVQMALCREPYNVRVALVNNVQPSSPLLYRLANDNSKAVLKALINRPYLDKDIRKLAESKLSQIESPRSQSGLTAQSQRISSSPTGTAQGSSASISKVITVVAIVTFIIVLVVVMLTTY